jgi:hypothetical protein
MKEKRMMKPRGWIFLLTLMALPTFASAEFYRYVDQEGKTHYTDDVANIPADQRAHVSQYEDASHESSLKKDSEKTAPNQADAEDALRNPHEMRPQQEPEMGKGGKKVVDQTLKETGTALEQEYQALMEERKQLDEAAKTRTTPAIRRKLVEKIRDFNSRIKDYEKRRKAFNQDVEAYNASTGGKAQPLK